MQPLCAQVGPKPVSPARMGWPPSSVKPDGIPSFEREPPTTTGKATPLHLHERASAPKAQPPSQTASGAARRPCGRCKLTRLHARSAPAFGKVPGRCKLTRLQARRGSKAQATRAGQATAGSGGRSPTLCAAAWCAAPRARWRRSSVLSSVWVCAPALGPITLQL